MQTEIKVPSLGESITEVDIGQWLKKEGESVAKDENIVSLESEKATVDLPAPSAGVLTKILKPKGQVANVGEVIAVLDSNGAPAPKKDAAKQPEAKPAEEIKAEPRVMPAAERLLAENKLRADQVTGTGPGGRILKEDVARHAETKVTPAAPPDHTAAPPPLPAAQAKGAPQSSGLRDDEVIPMTRLRRTVAARLVESQKTTASLTTFNEVDLHEVMELRKQFQETFTAKFGVKLGFMSFFVKAAIEALKAIPQVNAEIHGNDVVYHKYYDIGVAIGGGKGLVVPVLRNAERMSFSQIELAIADFGKRAKENKITMEELNGGTFTISNGGVYGSLLSTPILNPPQSGILGMHTIQDRPVVREGQIVVRPMMYLALTYDHRIVDGREAVTFLKRIKETLETPARILLEI
ncbi:MAG TPA: 2-oxoglutarate dehydrogenase complex dihydrolipoyllysine-residue succinyltransferase [Verrucomicrobiae bacterium]|nr:2-oxoglutarate dehydrogenase complex dihydrolipoyllysine-residue succinyltransferase [Verrucomicrobiae bacterium]